MTTQTEEVGVITPAMLLAHWQGHRYVTRKVIEAFPEDKLFTFSIGGMRPFGMLIKEILTLGATGLDGVVTNSWPSYQEAENAFVMPCSKEQMLQY